MNKNEQEWIKHLSELGCLWIHDGNPKRPHASLTRGNHSNGFFNGSLIINDPGLCGQVCLDLWGKFLEYLKTNAGFGQRIHSENPKPQIFGTALGANDLTYQLGLISGLKRGFTEHVYSVNEQGKLAKTITLKRFSFDPGTPILMVEDVMTTGGTTRDSIGVIEEAGGIVLPAVLVICNRSGMKDLDGRKIIALIDKELPAWDPGNCPLCQQGSEPVRPKGNWDMLTATYD